MHMLRGFSEVQKILVVVESSLMNTNTPNTAREVIVIDAGVSDWKTLIAGLSPDIPVILLPVGGNGLEALAVALAGYGSLDALHLVSHGGSGRLNLGDLHLTSANLGEQGSALSAIASHLAGNSDVLVYGCSVAAGEGGQTFVQELSAALGGADIAASTDRTGPLVLGGDWDLEFAEGEIETVLPFTVQGMQGIDECLGCGSDGKTTTSHIVDCVYVPPADTVSPTVNSINRVTGYAAVTNATSVKFGVQFSEKVNNFDINDLTLTKTDTADGTITGFTSNNNQYWEVEVTGVTGNGTLRLDLKSSGTGIVDQATTPNAIAAVGFTSGQTFTIDNTVPTLDGTQSTPLDNATGIAVSANLVIDFTENIAFGSSGTITLQNLTTPGTVETFTVITGSATGSAGGTASISNDKLTLNPFADLLGNTEYSVRFSAGSLKDSAGNSLEAIADDTTYNFTTVAATPEPTLTSATYNASTNVLTVTAAAMTTGDSIDTTKLTLKGEGNNTYALAGSYSVTASSATSFSVTLNDTDARNVEGLLNYDGTVSVSNTTYNLAGAAGWDASRTTSADLTGNEVTVSNTQNPTITSATYDASTGVLTVTGSNMVVKPGATNDITVNKLTLRGEGSATRLLTSTNVEVTSSTEFSVTLNAADQAAVNQILNKAGPSSTGGATYNLAAALAWNTNINDDGAAYNTTPVTVSSVPVPTITSATYDATTGALVITGTGFLKLTDAANDIVANKFTLTGEGDASYTLTDTANVEITSGTAATLVLSSVDKAAINQFINKNLTISTGGTIYNLAAAEDWTAGAAAGVTDFDPTGNGVTVSNVAVPAILSSAYDASTGVLSVTGTGFLTRSGASNDIVANKFTFRGEGGAGASYTLNDTVNVEIASGTAFTVTLSTDDKAAVNLLVNKNGAASTSGTTYNLSAAEDWAAGAAAGVTDVDAINAIDASNVPVPVINAVAYNFSTNVLTVTGTGFQSKTGANNDIDLTKLTFTGESGATYTLTNATGVEITSATSFTVTLTGADLSNVEALLNQDGTSSAGGTSYNLSAAAVWNPGDATAGSDTSNAITVSNYAAPTITLATYDASTNVLTVTGANLVSKSGVTNDVAVSLLTLTGEGGSYALTSTDVEITNATTFAVTLNAADQLVVRGLLNKNGPSSSGSTTYNVAAAEDWMAGSPAAAGVADLTGNGITVSNFPTPAITSAVYDSDSGVLTVTGTDFFKKVGVTNDIVLNKLTFTGEGGATYTLTSASNVEITSATAFSVTLTGDDKTNVDALLDLVGTQSSGGTTYNLAAVDGWLGGADAAVNIADATNAVTVSIAPKLTSATYDAATGTLVVTGSNMQAKGGATNDITVNKLTLTGEGGVTYTLTTTPDVELTSATSFTLVLSAADKAAINQIVNKDGTASTGGTTFNLAGADDWNAQVTAGDTSDTTGNGITASSVAAPRITSATYNATTGALVVTGTGFLKLDGATNDILANKLTFTGEGGATYTLTDSANVEITSGTAFTVMLSAADKAALNQIINKNGPTASDTTTTYNLAAAEDWTAGADAVVVVADLAGNGVTASNVSVPMITSATYHTGTGVLVVTGTGFVKHSGASNDIDISKLKFTGQGDAGAAYTLTSASDVEITSGTSFTVTLGGADKTTVDALLNKNGTSANDSITYNLAALEDWASGADSSLNVIDETGNGITVTVYVPPPPPDPTPTPTPTPPDNDDVPDEVEDEVPGLPPPDGGAPVAGDGNGDGTPDSEQSGVTSVPFLETPTAETDPQDAPPIYVSLVADSDKGKPDTSDANSATLSNVRQLDAPPNLPPEVQMPLGLISFESEVGSSGTPGVGVTETFSLYIDTSANPELIINAYFKQDGDDNWVNIASPEFGGQVVTEGGRTRLDFALTDGGPFDSDGVINGSISDPGAPGYETTVPPVSTDTDNDQFPDALEAANGLSVGIKDNDVFGSSKFFVMQLYRDNLYREAEIDGLNYWIGRLDAGVSGAQNGLSREQVAALFLTSPEFLSGAGAIARLYFGLFERMPDAQGMNYWVEQLQSGTSMQQIATGFTTSPEFAAKYPDASQHIQSIYQSTLGRAPSSNELSQWTTAIAGGATLADLAIDLTTSTDFIVQSRDKVSVSLDYLGLLGRPSEPGGFEYWLERQTTSPSELHLTELQVINGFLVSPEYHDRFLPSLGQTATLVGVSDAQDVGLV